MCSIKCVVGTWLGLSCFSEFVVGFSVLKLKSEYIKNKEIYNRNNINLSIPDLNLAIFLAFLLGITLAITLYCWLDGNKKAKICARVTGIIYGIIQIVSALTGIMPVLFLIPVLMIVLIIQDMKK